MYQERDDRIPIIDGGDFEQLQQQLVQASKVDKPGRGNKPDYFPLTLDLSKTCASTGDLTVPVNALILGLNFGIPAGEEWILTGSIIKDKLSRDFQVPGGYFVASYNTESHTGKLRTITHDIHFRELLLLVNDQTWKILQHY